MAHSHKTFTEVKNAIIDANGILYTAAKNLGISYQALSKRIKKNPKLQDILEKSREGLVDKAESKLVEAMESRESWAINKILNTIGKDRGWLEKQSIEHDFGEGAQKLIERLNGALERIGSSRS